MKENTGEHEVQLMNKPVVLILGKLPPPYMGPAIATSIILNSRLKDRYRLVHLDTRINKSLRTMGRWSIVKLVRMIFIYLSMAGLLLRHRPSLALIPISQSTPGFMKDGVFIFLARMFGVKVLIQLRGSNFLGWLEKSSAATRWFVKRMLGMTAGVIVLGEKLRYLFEGFFPPERIHVVPNGGNYNLQPAVKGNGHVRLLYLANLQPSKGIEDVIDAVDLLVSDGMNGFSLDVAGDWRSRATKEYCLRKVKEGKLPVHFHPPAGEKEKFGYMSSADVFIFTPRAPEGHPWVIVEALAAGLPVISTDQGAIKESVSHGVNGYIVNPREPQEIASRIGELISDGGLRNEMGKNSRRIYEENFTEERMTSRLDDVFRKVISNA